MVYVLNKDGKPLMPTNRCAKVRVLLKEKKAKIVKSKPFTIQLLYETINYTQPIKNEEDETLSNLKKTGKKLKASLNIDQNMINDSISEVRQETK
ncbi:RRXRR domain-containing protein [Clostridium tyrobutyricum]|uniref:RRXRR domain-containing protein n=1 Tax=Clostridium tyrobutyricum TaxID=1519 RepID=UPI000E841559|nr:RRXRR domain-containing protein [Clostridium tyrobutyricum]HBG38937.1 hypothetical protein [Clostridiaceae bacterium]